MNAVTSLRVETSTAGPAEHQHVLDALAACNRPEMVGRDDTLSTRTLVGVQPGRSRMSVMRQASSFSMGIVSGVSGSGVNPKFL